MGEVYKANDTRLDRSVAIKVLPPHFAESAERRARFEREAKAISRLNHPHICTLYDVGEQDGIRYLVMEHIEGETLAERLKKGALPLDKAIDCGIQVADGLAKAHRAGIVHRDLKPGNIMLTKQGVKLLDFGLAKPMTSPANADDSDAPTRQQNLTEERAIVGTLQYMAPEQLEGDGVDARTDLFALGTVLYEIVTGNKAFAGESQASLITAIMSSEPPPASETSTLSPPTLDRLINQCLTKDPDERMQSAHDAKLQLQSIGEADTLVRPAARPRPSVAWLVAAIAVTAALTGFVVSHLVRSQALPEGSPARFAVELSSVSQAVDVGLAVSPRETGFVYSGSSNGVRQLFHRSWDALEAKPLPGTEEARLPFFSPDGIWVGYFANQQLKKVPLTGGPPVVVCEVPDPLGGSWAPDGTIVFASRRSHLRRVSSSGGVPAPLSALNSDQGEVTHTFPSFLPRGKAIIFTVQSTSAPPQLAILDLTTGEHRLLIGGSQARYATTGHVVFQGNESTQSLLAAPFDADRLELTGEPVAILEDGSAGPGAVGTFDIGLDGTLVYLPTVRPNSTLVWVSREGRETPVVEEPAMYRYPRLAPGGARAVVAVDTRGRLDIWVHDVERGTRTRLTRSSGESVYPLWTPDGGRVTFSRSKNLNMNYDLFWAPSDGSGEPELLLEREGLQFPFSWSPDGRTLAFGDTNDIWVLPVGGQPVPFLTGSAQEQGAAFSPDGRWLAYVSDESGRHEVYVRPYPKAEGKWTISTDGGRAPLWSPQSGELFYRSENRVMVVPVTTDRTFTAGTPRPLFEGSYSPPSTGGNPYYDVSPDGQRFLMLAQSTRATRGQVHVVLDWFAELERLVPTND